MWSCGPRVGLSRRSAESGRTFASVKTRASHRGCLFDGPVNRAQWTPELDRRLVELWELGKSCAEIGEELGRTESSVQSRSSRLNCGDRARPRRAAGMTSNGKRPWTADEDRRLTEFPEAGAQNA